MKQEELNNLKCGDIVQCTNHPKINGKSVEMFEGESIEERDTVCGCKIKDFKLIRD